MINTSSVFVSISQTPIVIDANIAAWAVLPNIAIIQTLQYIKAWHGQERPLLAPDIWIAEAGSVIRRCVFSKLTTKDEGQQAIDDLFALGIHTTPITQPLCQRAFVWASTLQQARLYDSFYLALAEERGAEFWTADKRLVNGAKQQGFAQIHWIGEEEPEKSIEKSA